MRTHLFSICLLAATSCAAEPDASIDETRHGLISIANACTDCEYSVDGTWMYDMRYPDWIETLDAFVGIGGDTVLRWGYVDESAIRSALDDAGCEFLTVNCMDVTVAQIQTAGITVCKFQHVQWPCLHNA